MPELPDSINLDSPPNVDRYERYFGRLPVQAVLNMMVAYQPGSHSAPANSRQRVIQRGMEQVYGSLLGSAQSGAIDISTVDEDTLQAVSDYLWNLTHMKKFQDHRKAGRQVMRAVVDHYA